MNDYKRLIADLTAAANRNSNSLNTRDTCRKAADAIEQLVADNESYKCAFADLHNEIANYCETIATLEKERDAAVEDIKKCWLCASCHKHIEGKEWCFCYYFAPETDSDGCTTCVNYEWRGVQNE